MTSGSVWRERHEDLAAGCRVEDAGVDTGGGYKVV